MSLNLSDSHSGKIFCFNKQLCIDTIFSRIPWCRYSLVINAEVCAEFSQWNKFLKHRQVKEMGLANSWNSAFGSRFLWFYAVMCFDMILSPLKLFVIHPSFFLAGLNAQLLGKAKRAETRFFGVCKRSEPYIFISTLYNSEYWIQKWFFSR